MGSSDIPTLEKLEARLARLQDRDKIPSLEKLEARLAKLQNIPYIPSKKPINEVDKLIEQIKSEIKLGHKSKELNKKRDQELYDRLNKLREDSPKKTESLFFNETKSIITDNIRSQANMAGNIAQQTNNEEERKSLLNSVIKLNEVNKITANISPNLEKQESKIFDIIANSLSIIYKEIEKVTTPAVSILKKVGSVFIDAIKSISKKSSDKQMKKTKETLKGLYETYADLKKVSNEVRTKFLKKHYNQIDQLQTSQEIFLETAKITKSIAIVGKQKVRKTQQNIDRIGNLRPPNTPNTLKTIKSNIIQI